MQFQPRSTRAAIGAQFPDHKSNPSVPAVLRAHLHLPGVGSLLGYEWFAEPEPESELSPAILAFREGINGGAL
jgi:hypothetical protein